MPLRVLLVDDDAERAKLVEEGLSENAVVTLATQVHGRPLLDLISRMQPDVIIMDCQSPDRDTIESLRQVAQSNPKPIVMFVEEQGSHFMQEAIEAGVSAYVIDGLKPNRVRPLIDTAMTRFKVMDGLRSELKKTKDDLAARKVIERAKGLLMERQQMTEEQAFSAMRDMSQQQSKPLKEVAESVIAIFDLIGTNPEAGSK
ncbi:MAG: ANTAR domain-containing protein [Pseudomonadota bacterium]